MSKPKPRGPLLLQMALAIAGMLAVVFVALWNAAEPERVYLDFTVPEVFLDGTEEEAEPCDPTADGVPTDLPGVNGCAGMQPPVEPVPPKVGLPEERPQASGPGEDRGNGGVTGVPGGPSAPAPSGPAGNPTGPTTGGPPGPRGGAQYGPRTGGPAEPTAPRPSGPTTGGPRGPSAPTPSGAAGRDGNGKGPGPRAQGVLFEYQPNSVVQGLDVLDRAQQGSVSTGLTAGVA